MNLLHHVRPTSSAAPCSSPPLFVLVLCVRACCHPIYSGRQACGCTSRGVTQEEGRTGFLHLPSAVLALILRARRIQRFLFLVDREVEFVY